MSRVIATTPEEFSKDHLIVTVVDESRARLWAFAGTTLQIAICAGVATGWLEVGLTSARARLWNEALLGPMDPERGLAALVPLSSMMVFLGLGVVLAICGLVFGRWRGHVATGALLFLLLFSTLLLIRRVHPLASAILAFAIAARAAPWMARREGWIRRFGLRSAAIALGTVVIGLGVGIAGPILREWREYRALAPAPAGAPNVLLIVLDTVRGDALGSAGYGRPTTPFLDEFGAGGVRFSRARSTSPWTLPSHSSMFTGRLPHELSVGVDRGLDATYPTVAGVLSSRGYESAGFVGNTFYANAGTGLARGFLHYEDYPVSLASVLSSSNLGQFVTKALRIEAPRKPAREIIDRFLGWLDRRGAGAERPFFVFLNFFDAHDPYFPAPGHRWRFGEHPTDPKVIEAIANWSMMERWKMDPSIWEVARRGYDSCIAGLDEDLRMLFGALKRRGVLEQTLVIVTSDHGEQFGEHGTFGHGTSLYQQELEVPLMVSWPGRVPSGKVVNELVSLRDLPATISEVVGVVDPPFPGRSLTDFWDESRRRRVSLRNRLREPIFAEVDVAGAVSSTRKYVPSANGPIEMVEHGTLTYFRHGDGVEELYYISSDAGQYRNLARDPARRSSLERMREWLRRTMAPIRLKTVPEHAGEHAPSNDAA